ncbi:uncharacterized protein LOC134243596, partial [Saccostrea cucullata]|uniref:uncharacterized protein LOC134243596 n=1 Tax=Saccostrea cuccullata TaxID=36930 RepID=UPI002ED29365
MITILLICGCVETNPGPADYKKHISIVHNNVCSLPPKLDIIRNEFSGNDIIAITETHLDQSIDNSNLSLDGYYQPVRKDRNRYGGGVALYISTRLNFKVRNDLNFSDIEILWAEIQSQNQKFLVGVIYRPPNSGSDFWDKFTSTVERALDTEMKLFLLGDFNVNMLAPGNNTFKNLLLQLNLSNVVLEPTNFTTDIGTCIDLVLTNDPSKVKSVVVDEPICSSHSPVSIEISFQTYKQHAFKRTIRNYDNANYQGLNNDLQNVNWDEKVFTSNNMNDVYENFTCTYLTLVDKHIPKKQITIRPSDKPYITTEIRRKMRQRKRIHKKAMHTKNPLHWQKFRQVRNEVIDLVRKSRKEYKIKLVSQLIDKSIPPGKWWRIAKSIARLKKQSSSPSSIKSQDGRILIHPIDKAEEFNNFFSNISHIENEPDLPEHGAGPPDYFCDFEINDQDVLDQLSILDPSKPCGPDGISPRILKETHNDINTPTMSLTQDLEKIRNWSKAWAVDFNSEKTVNVDFTRKQISYPNIQFGYGEYADVVWDNCTQSSSELLEKVQIEAARIITGLRVNSSRTCLYGELGWEPLYLRREKHKLQL